MTTRTALGAAALLLALAGCSDDGGATTAAPTSAAPAAAPADGGSYPGTAEVIARLNGDGLTCEDPLEGTYEGVSEAQGCILNGTEDVVVLSFATPAEREEYLSTKDELASVVVGQDWAVQTVLPETARRVAEVLGGEVREGAAP